MQLSDSGLFLCLHLYKLYFCFLRHRTVFLCKRDLLRASPQAPAHLPRIRPHPPTFPGAELVSIYPVDPHPETLRLLCASLGMRKQPMDRAAILKHWLSCSSLGCIQIYIISLSLKDSHYICTLPAAPSIMPHLHSF